MEKVGARWSLISDAWAQTKVQLCTPLVTETAQEKKKKKVSGHQNFTIISANSVPAEICLKIQGSAPKSTASNSFRPKPPPRLFLVDGSLSFLYSMAYISIHKGSIWSNPSLLEIWFTLSGLKPAWNKHLYTSDLRQQRCFFSLRLLGGSNGMVEWMGWSNI